MCYAALLTRQLPIFGAPLVFIHLAVSTKRIIHVDKSSRDLICRRFGGLRVKRVDTQLYRAGANMRANLCANRLADQTSRMILAY